ncbi:alpha/beta fold hydrolase [Streptomyces reniochalinae]|uniref:Alpha/beta fold hydrolase n=1 Tax=Streptomyces reniochalinae TaxID=2250578 RepID=A0A367EE91_9ACTN|nr:alpha/beta fold hydrolase [Streptomyces reniochalinae]RCG16394.1 alpha/beta fold hydrolase [Streptomyces reniochalinae]
MPATLRHPGTVLTDHVFPVPLDHDRPDGEQIEVYAREVVAAGREREELPWLLFLQGGPGSGSPRPVGQADWLAAALRHYRVLLLDQRGTGRSTPANRQSLAARGTPEQQAAYLAHFRADSIVRDAEVVRERLLGGDGRWSTLGQSFGGFCTLAYLSRAPHALREAFVTGGLPGLRVSADDVYRAAYPRVAAKNAAHYARYPQDVEAVRRIAAYLAEHEVRLPDGSPLTVQRFQYLGMLLGQHSGSHVLHYLLEGAWIRGASGPELSDAFLAGVYAQVSLAANPLFAVVHEAAYAQRSVSTQGTGWAAQRLRGEFPAFDAERALEGGEPVLFSGEMIYPWMFDLDPALVPLAEAAHLLAERGDWPDLYDTERLAANEVPVYAAVYHDDMYVDRDHSLATARAVPHVRTWVTSAWEHDALRVSRGTVLERLIGMARGEV